MLDSKHLTMNALNPAKGEEPALSPVQFLRPKTFS
jgi:hypothetical protein